MPLLVRWRTFRDDLIALLEREYAVGLMKKRPAAMRALFRMLNYAIASLVVARRDHSTRSHPDCDVVEKRAPAIERVCWIAAPPVENEIARQWLPGDLEGSRITRGASRPYLGRRVPEPAVVVTKHDEANSRDQRAAIKRIRLDVGPVPHVIWNRLEVRDAALSVYASDRDDLPAQLIVPACLSHAHTS